MKRPLTATLAVLLAGFGACGVQAQEANWSGFATLGYARSDSAYTYQRFINNGGTLNTDSLIAGQLDLRLTPQWSSTVQVKLAPADNNDSRWRPVAAWAFVGWRPDNDWLVRAGKVRAPFYLYSESLDVGVSTEMARLPYEVYSISPTNDVTGLYFTRSGSWGEREWSIDAYGGEADATARLWHRDGLPPVVAPGSQFLTVKARAVGLVLTARDPSLTLRLGVHAVETSPADGSSLPVTYPRVDLAPGVGYWQVDPSMPGPGIATTRRIRNQLFTAGVDWQVGDGWRLTGEFVRMHQLDTELGSDSTAGYLALFKRMGAYTPYVSVARQRSSDGLLEWRRRLTSDSMPSVVPGAAQINAAQRLAGESLYVFDQRSASVGMSYALSPTAKLKAEWMQTRVGEASNHFDTPAGQPDANNLRVNTLSVNVSVAF